VSYSSQVVLPFPSVRNPVGIAVDTAGNLYVADKRFHRVLKLDAVECAIGVISYNL
jgi:DNA-binding beta-propeller fold protein YncE